MKTNLLTVSASPHLRGPLTVRDMHVQTMIALAPALLAGFYFFGLPAIITVALCMVSAYATEVAICKGFGLKDRSSDLHAVLMGMTLGMVMPAGAPFWLPMVGGFLAIALAKMVFGGLGHYPMNPVVVAWGALSLSWPEKMNMFLAPNGFTGPAEQAETPLMLLRNDMSFLDEVDLLHQWVGNTAGAIGEVAALLLILGGAYLIARRIVPWQIPAGVIAGAVAATIVALIFDPAYQQMGWEGYTPYLRVICFHLAVGTTMITAFFIAPEPVSSPVTPKGMLYYGLCIGAFTVIVRHWGASLDGAFYGVLIFSAATPIFDRIKPRVLGKVVED